MILEESEIRTAVETSINLSDTLRKLGYNKAQITGAKVNWLKVLINRYSISTEHFESRQEFLSRIAKMKSFRDQNELYNRPELDVKDYRMKALVLRNYLTFNKIEEKCSECGLSEWNEKPLRLDIDHIDSNPHNNKLINLQFLCPNCHRQKPLCRRSRN